MHFRSQRFDPDRHDVSDFTCGEPSLDSWLREQAAHKVARSAVPSRVGRGGPVEIPAVLLARLALSTSLQGQGLGEVLVADALARIVEATRTVAARLVTVDALHERVAQFYESLGFRRVPDSLLLVQKIADIEAALTAPTPARPEP